MEQIYIFASYCFENLDVKDSVVHSISKHVHYHLTPIYLFIYLFILFSVLKKLSTRYFDRTISILP